MSGYDDAIDQVANYGPRRVAQSIDDNPDNAQKAVDLSNSTGVPAPAVFSDLDGYRRQHKLALAQRMVQSNPELDAYVKSHPLAASVSNDDYGNLNNFSQGAKQSKSLLDILHIPRPIDVVSGMLSSGAEKAAEGYSSPGLYSEIEEKTAGMSPVARAAIATAAMPAVLLEKIMGVAGGATLGGIYGGAKEIGGEKFARDVASLAEYQMTKGEGHIAEAPLRVGQAARVQTAIEAAKPWTDHGLEPPTGVHPIIDQMKGELNAKTVEGLQQDLATAQESMTKERSSEMFGKFVEQHFGDSQISISGDKVAELYGENPPLLDDGMLGWVPGIEDKLNLARETGADVHIPIKDWMTNIDPALAKELNDDLRIWPGGITKREMAEVAPEPRALVNSPIAQVRDQAGLEPVFSVGDRALKLERYDMAVEDAKLTARKAGLDWEGLPDEARERYLSESKQNNPSMEGTHDFKLMAPDGASLGELNMSADPTGKHLYVDLITGHNGLGPRDFGPSLMRDLLRQIKAEFPEAETLSGHRVSGAREKAGSVDAESAEPIINLRDEGPNGWSTIEPEHFVGMLDDAWKRSIGKTEFWLKPKELYTEHEAALDAVVREELTKMVGDVETHTAQKIGKEGVPGDVRGTFFQFRDRAPMILVDLFSQDAIGTARHEGIHFLRREGFFNNAEWATLSEAVEREDWIGRYNIEKRYPGADIELHIEEAVAEAYREWASVKDEAQRIQRFDVRTDSLFQKMQAFWESIKSKFTEILGQSPDANALFEDVYSGAIKDRGVQEGTPGKPSEAFSIEDKFDGLKANATGLNVASYKRLQKMYKERYEADLAASVERQRRLEAKEQTKEWKDNYKNISKEVEETIRQRPDVAADLFFTTGDLYGHKLGRGYHIRAQELSAEQKEALPKNYYAKEGLPLDEVATMFGFKSGDAMVEKLVEYNKGKREADLGPQEFVGKIIKDESNRQMQAKYGNLDDNIMDAAKDHALAENEINILAEEMYAAAEKAGVTAIDKNVAKAWAMDQFSRMKLSDINSDRFMTMMGKHGRDAERSLIADSAGDAVVSMQKRFILGVMAVEARKIEKEQVRFDKDTKRWGKPEITNADPQYTNFVHQIMNQIGKPVRRLPDAIRDDMAARGTSDLGEFVAGKAGNFREIPVWPDLYDAGWNKPYKELSAEEFRGVRDTLKSLVHNARDELKIERAGEAESLEDIKSQMKDSLKRFKELGYDIEGKRTDTLLPNVVGDRLRTMKAAHLQMETIMNRLDKWDSRGPWHQYVMRDLVEGANQESAWRREYAKRLTDLPKIENPGKLVENDLFKLPRGSEPLAKMTRENLIAVMLNVGTESNLDKLARGYKVAPEAIMDWVNKHATEEDWKFARGMWDIHKDLKVLSDNMYRRLTGGVAADNIPGRTIETKHGPVDGGYYPVIYHTEFEGESKKLAGGNPLEQENYVRATVPAGYTKARTGYAAPMNLTLDMGASRLAQMIHDVAMRPAIINASKIFMDKGIREEIANRLGSEYRDLLTPYLSDMANSSNRVSKSESVVKGASEFMRQNMITTLIGLNPGTVMKHGPTAFVQSVHEVGLTAFSRAFAEVGKEAFLGGMNKLLRVNEATSESNWQFAMNTSQELQRRIRNYQETLYGANDNLIPNGKFMSFRETVMNLASKPVAFSDMLSAVPTWLARYDQVMKETGVHGDAINEADLALRRAHGSTAITNRPEIMRNANPWFTSVYNFFNHIMNRQMEMVWQAGETFDLVKAGEWKAASKELPRLTGQMFAYVIAPAIIEELVSPLPSKDDESYGKKAGKALAFTLGASWIGVREITNALLRDADPSAGLLSTMGQTMTRSVRDFNKEDPLSIDHRGRLIQDASGFMGATTGVFPLQLGKAGRYLHDRAYDVGDGPDDKFGWLVGLRYGTNNKHSKSWEDWKAHH